MKKEIALEALSPVARTTLLEFLIQLYIDLSYKSDHPRGTKSKVAAELGISPQAVSDLLAQRYYPSDALTERILSQLFEINDFTELIEITEVVDARWSWSRREIRVKIKFRKDKLYRHEITYIGGVYEYSEGKVRAKEVDYSVDVDMDR